MKNTLLEIMEVVGRHTIAIFLLPILASLIIGVINNRRVIIDKHLSITRRGEGLIFCLFCGLSSLGVFLSALTLAFYFSFNLIEFAMPMYCTIALTGLLIGFVLNFKLLNDTSRKKQLKGTINAFATIFVIVSIVFACSQLFIH